MAYVLLSSGLYDSTGYIFQYLGIIVTIIALAYFSTVAVSKFYKTSLGSRHIKLIEKTNLATDKSLWLVELGASYYFMYVDKNGMQKLDVISKSDIQLDDIENKTNKSPSFKSIFKGKMYETVFKDNKEKHTD